MTFALPERPRGGNDPRRGFGKIRSGVARKILAGPPFSLLAKYIFTSDWLSVQVHPDDAYAAVHDPGNLGKCEMWYFLRPDPEAAILLGLKPGVTKEQLLRRSRRELRADLLQRFRPRAGGSGVSAAGNRPRAGTRAVLFEVEENSDLTYRLDDFGRPGLDGKPRPLHLEKGLDVIRPELPPLRDLPRSSSRRNTARAGSFSPAATSPSRN